MPLDLFSDIAFSLLGLLQGTLLTSIPVFIAVALLGVGRRKLAERYSLSWAKSAALVTFLSLFAIVLAANYVPFIASLGQQTLGDMPQEFAEDATTLLMRALLQPLRLAFVAFVLSLLLLPLELIGDFIFGALKERWAGANPYIHMFISVFITVLAAMLLAILVLPAAFGIDAITGILYFVFIGAGA